MTRSWAAAAAMLCLAPAALAQDGTVSISGSNTARVERYETRGDVTASPYPFTTTTGYDELLLNLSWQPSSFDRWRALFAGVANDSPYRSPERGFVPERIVVARENGEGALAYRAEAGDFFAFTSLRTQQRPLKGAALELQPDTGRPDIRTSLLAFGGTFTRQAHWRDLSWSRDNTLGLSWLTEIGSARVTVNALRNERAADAATGAQERTQNVGSIVGEIPFRLGATTWRAEAEAAVMRGDHDGAFGSSGARDRRDTGLFGQVSGSLTGEPLSWRLRAERYGQDYRPFGAAIPFARRSAEGHVSWQSPGALVWRARVQDFRDDYEGANPLDTRTVGAGVSGLIAPLRGSLNVDVFRQDLERADRSMDQRNLTALGNLSAPIGTYTGQVGAFYQRIDNRLSTGISPRTKELTLSLVIPFGWSGVQGTVIPGLGWRDVSNSPFATDDFTANLQAMVFGGPHRFSLTAGRIGREPTNTGVLPEVVTVNFAADYRYRWGRHEFGVDVTLFDREPRPGEKTEAWRAGMQWTYNFDNAPAMPVRAAAAALAPAPTGPIPGDAGIFAAIGPGDDLEAALARLAGSGFAGGVRMPGAVTFDARLLPEVEGRQRVALVHSSGRIERVALVVALDESGSGDDASRTYDRVRRALIDRYGRPTVTVEEGAFGPGLARELTAGRFVRAAEWTTGRGTLRLGIPRRLDGSARIEVHHASRLGSARDAWGWEPR